MTRKTNTTQIILCLCIGILSSSSAWADKSTTLLDTVPLLDQQSTQLVAFLANQKIAPAQAHSHDHLAFSIKEFAPVGRRSQVSYGLAAGMLVSLADNVFLNIDLNAHRIEGGGTQFLSRQTRSQVQVTLAWQPVEHLSLFAGPGLGLNLFEGAGSDARSVQDHRSFDFSANGTGVQTAPAFFVGLEVY